MLCVHMYAIYFMANKLYGFLSFSRFGFDFSGLGCVVIGLGVVLLRKSVVLVVCEPTLLVDGTC